MDYNRIIAYVVAMVALTIALNLGGWALLVRILDRLGVRQRFFTFVGVRHLRGKKSGFLTAIGLLSIVGVSFSSCTVTTVLSVMGGFSSDLRRKIVDANAHIVIDRYGSPMGEAADAPKGSGARDAEEDWRALLKRVRALPEVRAATPIVHGEVMVNAKTNNNGMLLRGIEPESFSRVSGILHHIEEGKAAYLSDPKQLFLLAKRRALSPWSVVRQRGTDDTAPADTASDTGTGAAASARAFIPAPKLPGNRVLPALIVGREIARALRLYVGEVVKVISPIGDIGPTGPIPKSRPFRVGGIFFSGMYTIDEHYAYTSLQAAQEFFGLGDAIHEIHVAIANPDDARSVAAVLSKRLGKTVRVRSWQELNSQLFSALQIEKIAMFVLLSIAILVASFSIVATLTMLVLEKSGEISVLMTIGATAKDVGDIFRFEGFLIGAVGTVTGLLVGWLLCLTLTHVGLPIPPEVWYIDKLPVDIDPAVFAAVGVVSLLVTMAATIYPAKVAAAITPVEGLKK